jgi:integrase
VAQQRKHRDGVVLAIPETKTDVARRIPLSTRAQAILEELPARVDGSTWGMKADSISQAWGRSCRRLKIVDLRFHDLRHEGTSRLFEGKTFGRPLGIAEAALVTGHRDVRQLMRYTQLKPEDIAPVDDGDDDEAEAEAG